MWTFNIARGYKLNSVIAWYIDKHLLFWSCLLSISFNSLQICGFKVVCVHSILASNMSEVILYAFIIDITSCLKNLLSNPFLHLNFSAFLPFLCPFSVLFLILCTFFWGQTGGSTTVTRRSARRRKAYWQDYFSTLPAYYLTENMLLELSCTEFWLVRVASACYSHKVQARVG